jgi:hypothetical protein
LLNFGKRFRCRISRCGFDFQIENFILKLMKNINSAILLLFLSLCVFCFETASAQQLKVSKKTEVFVLSTLHQFHAENKNYSFEKLSEIIEKLKPDVLAVELTPGDLASRREQKTKQEYQKSIFPLADKHRYTLVPMEPAEPKFSKLVGSIRNSEKNLREKSPDKAAAFAAYSDNLYEFLFRYWTSPAAVNAGQTDALFEVKHNFQNALYGTDQARGWEEWNRQFLDKILEAAAQHKGRRIVVTVGAEHAYWLRKHLRENSTVTLLEPAAFFRTK